MNKLSVLLLIIGFINTFSFILMCIDKRKSIIKEGRVRETRLFLSAICFGGIGVLLGMWLLGHKTKKWYFNVGIPLITIQNIITLYTIYALL